MLLAEGVEVGQRVKKIALAANYETIVLQTREAMKVKAGKAAMKGQDWRRYADALAGLGLDEEALAAVREAQGKDAGLAVSLKRQEVELLLKLKRSEEAEKAIHEYEAQPDLSERERAWAMGARGELLVARREFADARAVLKKVLELDVDPVTRGETAYRYGLCAWELGEPDEAERQFRVTRDLLTVRHPLDAEAAYRLGRIFEDREKPAEAAAFYQAVMTSHPDSPVMLPSRLGRAVCRVMQSQDEAGLEDFGFVVRQMERPTYRKRLERTAVGALKKGATVLSGHGNYQGALELLALEKVLTENPEADFWARVSMAYAKRADQLEAQVKDVDEDERAAALAKVSPEARSLRVRAGDAYLSQAKALTVADNDGHGAALQRAIEFYDRAGDVRSVVATLELFVKERPSDMFAPEATLRLGLAYMAAGDFERATQTFEHNRVRYAQSLAASKSAVPMAQALIARGAAFYPRAEAVLREMLETDRTVTPDADEFRNALFELGQLYYRQERYEESIGRFDEMLKRYPKERRLRQAVFLMAEGYRRSAALLEAESQKNVGGATTRSSAEVETARRERVGQAQELFKRVIELSRAPVAGATSMAAAGAGKAAERGAGGAESEIEKSQLRLAHFYRADCAYDLGEYAEAIKLYNQAAYRYHDDASSLAALVQIVNSHVALGNVEEAKSANKRAKELLKRMPEKAFTDGSFALPREYWQRWLDWSNKG